MIENLDNAIRLAFEEAKLCDLKNELDFVSFSHGFISGISYKNKDKDPFHSKCKNIFIEYVKKTTGIDYYWSAKDATNLKQLMQKIKKYLSDNSKTEITGDRFIEGFTRFLLKIKDSDKWVYSNLTIPIINSQFNNLVIKMSNAPKLVKVRAVDGGDSLYVTKEKYEQNKHYYKLIY